MKRIATLLFLLSFFACQTECEKDHTGTVRIINYHSKQVDVTLNEWFTPSKLIIAPGEVAKVTAQVNFKDRNSGLFVNEGYQLTARYKIEGETEPRDATIQPYQCTVVDVYLTD
jgi:hypothetical protein